MIVGVPKESYPGERRVALVPLAIPNLTKAGLEVVIETAPASRPAIPTHSMRRRAQRSFPTAPAVVFGAADIVVQVLCYGSNDVGYGAKPISP